MPARCAGDVTGPAWQRQSCRAAPDSGDLLFRSSLSAIRDAPLTGTLSVVGYPSEIQLQIMNLTFGRKKLTSSGTGEREARPRC